MRYCVHSPKRFRNKARRFVRHEIVETEDCGLTRGVKTALGLTQVLLAAMVWVFAMTAGLQAGGPIETSIFAVQGVDVDVTSTDAAAAKNQALLDVQVKAFFQLVGRLGTPELVTELQAKLKPEDITPYLRSLSIEQESSAPGRYIGKFTVRFLPEPMNKLFSAYGIRLPSRQGDPILVLPVWRGKEANQLWEDNIWRKAWLELRGEQGLVPLIVPLGDLEDSEAIDAEAALLKDPIKIEAIRRRYGAPTLLLAQAQLAEGGGIHMFIEGETEFGKVSYNKIVTAEDGNPETAAITGVQTFQNLLFKAYTENAAKVAAEEAARRANERQEIAVSVPFSSPTEWNSIRSRILAAPNVMGVDVSSLSFEGAVVRLVFRSGLEALQENMERVGLRLSQYGENWVIQPL